MKKLLWKAMCGAIGIGAIWLFDIFRVLRDWWIALEHLWK